MKVKRVNKIIHDKRMKVFSQKDVMRGIFENSQVENGLQMLLWIGSNRKTFQFKTHRFLTRVKHL